MWQSSMAKVTPSGSLSTVGQGAPVSMEVMTELCTWY
jgi:hypothetical protein